MGEGAAPLPPDQGAEPPLQRIDALLARLAERVEVLPGEVVPLDGQRVEDLLGRVLAASLRAEVSHPPSDVSAMDGWAVRTLDLRAAGPISPTSLRCVGDAAAGVGRVPVKIAEGECTRIATGAPVPHGADSVVPVERAFLEDPRTGATTPIRIPKELPTAVWFDATPVAGAHIRRKGEDMKVGDLVADTGAVIDAALLSAIYTSGVRELMLVRRPRVAILTSGDELSATAGPAHVRDSNGPALSALAIGEGAVVVAMEQVGDDADATDRAVSRLAAICDLLVTTGGVSVGAHDHVGGAIRSHFDLVAWRAAIQPGKPVLLATRREGEASAQVAIGIPGNPVSAFVIGMEVLLPLVRLLTGRPASGQASEGVLREAVRSPVGRRAYLRLEALRTSTGDLDRDDAGRIRVRTAGGQGSHQTAALAWCDALGVIPEEIGDLPVGAGIRLHLLPRAFRRIER